MESVIKSRVQDIPNEFYPHSLFIDKDQLVVIIKHYKIIRRSSFEAVDLMETIPEEKDDKRTSIY
jgi:hypothetical protein